MQATIGHRPPVAIYARTWIGDRPGPLSQIDQQIEAVREACDWLGLEVVEVYRDENVNDWVKLMDRPSGWRLISDARARRFSQVVVYDLQRLGAPTSTLIDGHLWLQAADVTWRALAEELDTSTSEGCRMLAALTDQARGLMADMVTGSIVRGRRPSSAEAPRVAALFAMDDEDPGLQLSALHQFAHERDWQIGPEYVGDDHACDALLMDVHDQHALDSEEEVEHFDLVLVESLDCFGDVGFQITTISSLLHERMPLVTIKEGIDTSTEQGRFAMDYAVKAYHAGVQGAHEAMAELAAKRAEAADPTVAEVGDPQASVDADASTSDD